jgi:arylsulfatase
MEIYAGFVEHTDHHIGRLLDSIEALGAIEDMLVFLIIGDNGASAEGTPNGTFNEMISLDGAAEFETTEFLSDRIDQFGTPSAHNRYAVGWAHAMTTPFQWTKQVASHFGGNRNGTIVHWPKVITAKAEVRSQFHHIIDVGPTIFDVAGIPEPTFVNGIQQAPIHGVSMAYAFNVANAAERRETRYFEVACNRRTYHKGWTAVTRHSVPWDFGATLPELDDDVWELYDTNVDWSQANDVSAAHPEKLKDLQRLWLIEAVTYNVLPLDDRRIERFNSDIAGRPQLVKGNAQLLCGGMSRLSENSVLNLKNKSHSVTAEVEVPEGGANAVMVAKGGAFAGGLAKGGTAALFIDGDAVGEGRINATVPMIYSGDERCEIGSDTVKPVSEDYASGSTQFTGTVNWVELQIGDDNHDHLISPEELMRVGTSIQ